MKVPNLGEAHCGDGARQSAHVTLGGRRWRVRSFGGVSGGNRGKERGSTLLLDSGSTSHILWVKGRDQCCGLEMMDFSRAINWNVWIQVQIRTQSKHVARIDHLRRLERNPNA